MSLTRRNALSTFAAAAAQPAPSQQDEGAAFLLRLLQANDASVSAPPAAPQRLGRGANVAALVAAFCSPQSAHHHSIALLPRIQQLVTSFLQALDPDGLLDAGNLSSPPDTAFVVEALAASLSVARRLNHAALASALAPLDSFLLKVGAALTTGGIHTPNHRWVVCAALARIHALFPNPRYVARIDDWLGEGIYQDPDGLFPERSPNYARVETDCFLTLARLLHRPALLTPVRRHLAANVYLLQPGGELETVNSRRQDQARPVHVANFLLPYRYLAILDSNPTFSAVARLISERPGAAFVEGANPLIHFLDEPLLQRPLPPAGPIPSGFSQHFPHSRMLRIRRGARSATLYAGCDQPAHIASGLAHNPTFFNFHNGAAILDSVRMGGQFFSLGAFRAQSLSLTASGATLHQRLEAPYYQPLPRQFRNPQGDYALTPVRDGRFFSKLDFPHRPVSNVQILDQRVAITEIERGFQLEFEITGRARVPYTIEIAFRPGGRLTPETQFLKQGETLVYRAGADAIEVSPGLYAHDRLSLAGHSYQAHNAPLRAAGHAVYLTAFTPFRHTLTIRAV